MIEEPHLIGIFDIMISVLLMLAPDYHVCF